MIDPAAIPRPVRRLIKSVVYAYCKLTAGLRLLPDFLIIGAQRSGTTFLYNNLIRQPGVGRALTKEIHFFDVRFEKGAPWYQAYFPLRLHVGVERLGGGQYLTGEASPYYMFHPCVPARVASTLPQVKLIALLRNPVDRAYSHYQHERRRGFEMLTFEDALGQETERIAGEVDRMLGNECYNSFNHQHYSYLSRGIYVDQLQTWLGVFPKEQLLIVQSEQLFAEPAATLEHVRAFLELKHARSRLYQHHHYPRYPKMDARIRERLTAYFKPHNQRLFDYLGTSFDWDP